MNTIRFRINIEWFVKDNEKWIECVDFRDAICEWYKRTFKRNRNGK